MIQDIVNYSVFKYDIESDRLNTFRRSFFMLDPGF